MYALNTIVYRNTARVKVYCITVGCNNTAVICALPYGDNSVFKFGSKFTLEERDFLLDRFIRFCALNIIIYRNAARTEDERVQYCCWMLWYNHDSMPCPKP